MIYFIRSYNQYIKIGRSINLEERKNGLQTASPIKLRIKAVLPGDSKTESGLHKLFSHLRVRGDLFRYSEELKWYLRALQENPEISNIKTLYMASQKMRLLKKSKRLGDDHKLSQRIKRGLAR